MILYVRHLNNVAPLLTLRLCVAAWPTRGGDLALSISPD